MPPKRPPPRRGAKSARKDDIPSQAIAAVLVDIGLSEHTLKRLVPEKQKRLAQTLALVLRDADLQPQEQTQLVDAIGRALERCALATKGSLSLLDVARELVGAEGLSAPARVALSTLARILSI